MNNIQKHSDKTFEDIKHINEYGAEYWLARELAPVLEYTQWRNFFSVIEKAVEACANSGFNDDDHFADVSKMIDLPKGAQRKIEDIVSLTTADREIDLHEKQLEELKKQKKALMQLLLTGIVRVNVQEVS